MKNLSVLVRLFLLGFLFVINALGHSSARDNNILGQKGNQNELEVNSMFAQKETSDGIRGGRHNHPHHTRKLGFRGKNPTESSMVYSMNGKGEENGGGTSKISAEEDNDAWKKSMGSSQEGMDDQKTKDDKSMLDQPKASELTNFVVPRSSTTSNPSKKNSNPPLSSNAVQVKASSLSSTPSRPERQISEELVPQAEDEDTTTQKEEEEKEKTQNAFEVEEEIANLIHKDYKGMGRRKPPINNHEPRN